MVVTTLQLYSNDRGLQDVSDFTINLKRKFDRVYKIVLKDVILPNIGNVSNLDILNIRMFDNIDSTYDNIMTSASRKNVTFSLHPIYDMNSSYIETKVLGRDTIDFESREQTFTEFRFILTNYKDESYNFNNVIINSDNDLHNITFVLDIYHF